MNKKKLGTGLAALALVGVVGIGGSLAWFTDFEGITNRFNTGKIDIDLVEYDEQGNVYTEEGIDYIDVMPGNTETKRVVVTNIENEAWVRVKVTIGGLSLDEALDLLFIDGEDQPIQIREKDYIENEDGTLTFYLPVQHMQAGNGSGEYVAFKEIKIPTSWDNTKANRNFTIDVKAEAIQYENNPMGFRGVDESTIVEALPNE